MLREAYEKHKDVTRARQREQSLAGRDIGEIPKPVSPSRKGRCRNSLKMFLNVYFPEIFYLPWSPNHDRVIEKLETAIKEGGLFALAMPRGSGKTWICALGSLWAILYGWRRYVVFVSATDTMAVANMHKIHRQLETNRKLMGDFPEVCVPVARLEGITNRCRGQTYNGEKTYIRWGDNRLDMPSIPGSVCAGSIFESTSITSSNIRGKSHVTAFGVPLRPDFCLIDDPQRKESAASPEQCKKRLEIISADILRMAGPTETITAVMPCTVIERGDLSDQILDREKHPEWNGERMHLLDSFPDNLDLWDQYRAIWVESKRMHEGDIKDATTFYRKNREEMDKGAVCTWEQRYKKDEISGIQYAMNIFIENRKVFYSEFQNEPEEESDEAEQLNRDLIHQKLNGLNRLKVPLEASSITMYIDVHDKLLYYVIAAYAQGFTGAIIDYGTFPKQKVLDFEMNDARYIMEDIYSGMEGQRGFIRH